jgi:hypothetical protein
LIVTVGAVVLIGVEDLRFAPIRLAPDPFGGLDAACARPLGELMSGAGEPCAADASPVVTFSSERTVR